MITIYKLEMQTDHFGNTTGTSNPILFRFYDIDEVPDDLYDRVQRWANHYECSFDVRSDKGCRTFFNQSNIKDKK